MTSSASSTLREAGTSQPQRRRNKRRLSATHVLLAVVVILAFVLNLLVLSDRGSTVMVAIADQQIDVGSKFDPAALELVPIDAGFEGVSSMLTEADVAHYEGFVYTRAVSPGSPIVIDALGAPGTIDGLRTMSLPVSLEHAAGGSITVGDLVDVVSVVDGEATFIGRDLEVVRVGDMRSGAIGASTPYHLVLAVDEGEALDLAVAIESGSVEVIRATGAGS